MFDLLQWRFIVGNVKINNYHSTGDHSHEAFCCKGLASYVNNKNSYTANSTPLRIDSIVCLSFSAVWLNKLTVSTCLLTGNWQPRITYFVSKIIRLRWPLLLLKWPYWQVYYYYLSQIYYQFRIFVHVDLICLSNTNIFLHKSWSHFHILKMVWMRDSSLTVQILRVIYWYCFM